MPTKNTDNPHYETLNNWLEEEDTQQEATSSALNLQPNGEEEEDETLTNWLEEEDTNKEATSSTLNLQPNGEEDDVVLLRVRANLYFTFHYITTAHCTIIFFTRLLLSLTRIRYALPRHQDFNVVSDNLTGCTWLMQLKLLGYQIETFFSPGTKLTPLIQTEYLTNN